MRLITRLLELQESHGHLTDELLRRAAREARVPLYRVQGLVSFYPHFRTTPPPRRSIAVCRDMACWLADPDAPAHVRAEHANDPGVEVREVSCLGRCDIAPAALVDEEPICVARLNETGEPPAVRPRVEGLDSTRGLTAGGSPSRRGCDPYVTPAERFGLIRELRQMPHDAAIDRLRRELKNSGLRGMGGAGFPTTMKWETARAETRTPKYVICNADESEPGTFKDRAILAELPHLVVEGMLVAGFAIGASHGILFIRHEYVAERHSFEAALEQARGLSLLDQMDIEVFVSPGGYILGEETALLECLEDKRGEPRNKPPLPVTHGLFGQPTLINNVETLAMAAVVANRGAEWWKAEGRPGFAGLKFISVSGHVEKPGVYEIPVGTTVRELIEQAGGIKDGRNLLAFTPGGASSAFLPASAADTPLDFAAMAKAGSMLGSGALFVVAEGTDLFALATNVVRFFRNESCGKCVPCRLGTQQAVTLLEDVQAGKQERAALDVLPDLDETLRLTSICGLGQVALTPVMSVMKNFNPASSATTPVQ
jgi:formate dehydrogenase